MNDGLKEFEMQARVIRVVLALVFVTLFGLGIALGSGGNCYDCEDLKCISDAGGPYSNCNGSSAGCIAFGACEPD